MKLEEETRRRLAAEQELASCTGEGVPPPPSFPPAPPPPPFDVQLDEALQAAQRMVETERERFDKERTADRVRVIELQLELKRSREELRVEKERGLGFGRAGIEAAEHPKTSGQPLQKIVGSEGDRHTLGVSLMKRSAGRAAEDPELCALLNTLGECSGGGKWMREAGGYVCSEGGSRVTDEQASDKADECALLCWLKRSLTLFFFQIKQAMNKNEA